MSSHRYSPRPAEDYIIKVLPKCEVSILCSLPLPDALPAWNLFWLTCPAIDNLLEWGNSPKWYQHYSPVIGASRAVILDSMGDEAMRRKLRMHPDQFKKFFIHQDHSEYHCYRELGGQLWVDTVMSRLNYAQMVSKAKAERVTGGLKSILNLFTNNKVDDTL